MELTACLASFSHTGKIAQNRKEKRFSQQYSLIALGLDGSLREIITARFYNTPSRTYACIWVKSPSGMAQDSTLTIGGVYVSGGGYTQRYGYHRASAALQAAINDAGITLSADIDGRGEGAMFDALKAIGHALGYSTFDVFQAHG